LKGVDLARAMAKKKRGGGINRNPKQKYLEAKKV